MRFPDIACAQNSGTIRATRPLGRGRPRVDAALRFMIDDLRFMRMCETKPLWSRTGGESYGIVQNEPNSRRRRAGRGHRGGGLGAIMQNKPNLGRPCRARLPHPLAPPADRLYKTKPIPGWGNVQNEPNSSQASGKASALWRRNYGELDMQQGLAKQSQSVPHRSEKMPSGRAGNAAVARDNRAKQSQSAGELKCEACETKPISGDRAVAGRSAAPNKASPVKAMRSDKCFLGQELWLIRHAQGVGKTKPIARSGAPGRCLDCGLRIGDRRPAGRAKCAKQSQLARDRAAETLAAGAAGAAPAGEQRAKQTQFRRSDLEGQVPCRKWVMTNSMWKGPRRNKANSATGMRDQGPAREPWGQACETKPIDRAPQAGSVKRAKQGQFTGSGRGERSHPQGLRP
jgi:hypothetical protein